MGPSSSPTNTNSLPLGLTLTLLCLVLVGPAQADFWDQLFNPRLSSAPRFSGSAFYSLESQLSSVSAADGELVAFGDFNSDRYTDVFIVEPDRHSFTIYLWNTRQWHFDKGTTFKSELTIEHLAATDINFDGRMDVLIQGSPVGGGANSTTDLTLEWWFGDFSQLTLGSPIGVSSVPVTIFDYNQDMRPDLYGVQNGKAVVFLNSESDGLGNVDFTVETTTIVSPSAYSYVHSNSFVDLDGDCLADFVVTSDGETGQGPRYDMFLAASSGGYGIGENSVRSTNAPLGSGILTWADFDRDGTMDVLFPVCRGIACAEENSVHILYNVQTTICQTFFDSGCRKAASQCTADSKWKFEEFDAPSGRNVVIIPTSSFEEERFSLGDLGASGVRVQTGDYDLDGFTDLLIVSTSTTEDKKSSVKVWRSVSCSESLGCDDEATKAGRRTFSLVTSSQTKNLSDLGEVVAAAFFDFDEDGTNDIFVVSSPDADSGTFGVTGFFNNIDLDAFFFKTLGLNGVCTQWCSGTVLPDPKPYGVNQHGATIKYSMADLSGVSHSKAIAQLPQSAFSPLLTPYTINGLGRASTYIDYFYLGVPYAGSSSQANGAKHFNSWPGLIPNSQMVAIPNPLKDPPSWRAELYINPSGMTLWIIIAILAWLVVIGGIIFFFYWRERKEDEKEKKEREHLFSFRAL